MTLISDVLPEPERPNSAVSPAPASNADVEAEARPAVLDIDGQRHRAPGAEGAARQQLRGEQGGKEMASERASGAGPGVAARHLREGVDGGRQGLRLAGDVGDEGDGGAELAHRLGEAQDQPGDDARQRQRQGDGEEHPGVFSNHFFDFLLTVCISVKIRIIYFFYIIYFRCNHWIVWIIFRIFFWILFNSS